MTANSQQYDERWIELPDGQAMCALINGNNGWLMYLHKPGAMGMSSRNPNYNGPKEAMIEYRLNNGQVDAYPAAWAYDRSTIEKALRHFEETKTLPDYIKWHEDS